MAILYLPVTLFRGRSQLLKVRFCKSFCASKQTHSQLLPGFKKQLAQTHVVSTPFLQLRCPGAAGRQEEARAVRRQVAHPGSARGAVRAQRLGALGGQRARERGAGRGLRARAGIGGGVHAAEPLRGGPCPSQESKLGMHVAAQDFTVSFEEFLLSASDRSRLSDHIMRTFPLVHFD